MTQEFLYTARTNNLEVEFALRSLPVCFPYGDATGGMIPSCGYNTGEHMDDSKLALLQGTLDLMVLQTLVTMGTLHGYGIARRIEQVSGNEVLLNQGTIYASLVRLQQRGWIDAEWGTSDNNRRAKFYSITKRGRKQLSEDAAYWQRLSSVMERVLAMRGEEGKS
jgi:PadR family transcriptional regulator, regulatory protein PadR